MNYILSKVFNNTSYANDFLNGKLYINLLTSFGIGNLFDPKEEMKNKYRGDLNEGIKTNIPIDNILCSDSSYVFFKNLGGIPHGSTAIGELDSRYLNEHVMSLFAIYYDTKTNSLLNPDAQMLDFDEKHLGTTVIIYNPNEFLRRLITTLTSTFASPFWLAYGLVDYSLSLNNRHDTYEFVKTSKYKWQQEFRIVINTEMPSFKVNSDKINYDAKTGAILVDIGNISDIAFSIPTNDFVNLNFPPNHNWILHTSPEHICPFYPPIRNNISYACPILRCKDNLYYGTQALYPIIRDPQTYSINRIFAKKSIDMQARSDKYFLSFADLYFCRLLDIYKSLDDTESLNSLLTAIVAYMIILQIQDLADIHLSVTATGIQPSYHNLDITDKRLIDKSHIHRTIIKKICYPMNTDFAELASISDDNVFPEYEYEGEKYCRMVPNQSAVLSSGLKVSKGEAVWVKVSKAKWFVIPID